MPLRAQRAVTVAIVASLASSTAAAAQSGDGIPLTIGPDGCDPSALGADSGVIVFRVTNAGDAVGEFEILAGDTVVDEIYLLAGLTGDLVTRLDGGDYQLTCWSTAAPQGTLTVGGGPAPSMPPSAVVTPKELAAYQQAYQSFVAKQAGDLVTRTSRFAQAITSGDLDLARRAYAYARVPWEEIEPVAELFSDLDLAIDSHAEDFAGGEDDPAFAGFHAIERLLWVDRASGDLVSLASALEQNVIELQVRLASLVIQPRVMARGAGELVEEIAQSKLTGEEDRYSGTDLWSIRANLDGSEKIVDIVRPTLETAGPDYLAHVDAAFAAVNEVMDRLKTSDGFVLFRDISKEDLEQLQARTAGLSEVLAQLPGILGLSA